MQRENAHEYTSDQTHIYRFNANVKLLYLCQGSVANFSISRIVGLTHTLKPSLICGYTCGLMRQGHASMIYFIYTLYKTLYGHRLK